MKFDINVVVHLHADEQGPVMLRLDDIARHLMYLTQGVKAMSKELDQLEAEVAANTEVDQSAITLLQGLADQIAALKNDPVKLQALADSLRSSSASLAAAIVAHTPAEPA